MTALLISLWEDDVPALRVQKQNAPIYCDTTAKLNEAAIGWGWGHPCHCEAAPPQAGESDPVRVRIHIVAANVQLTHSARLVCSAGWPTKR